MAGRNDLILLCVLSILGLLVGILFSYDTSLFWSPDAEGNGFCCYFNIFL